MRTLLALLILCCALILPASAQFMTPGQADQATPVDIPNKAPDMVCFGDGPNWSVQMQQGRARNVGINEPDSYFSGKFVWVPNENLWTWQGSNTNGNGQTLAVNVQKTTCVDKLRKQEFPYKAQATLPAGDFVSGCCRKLKPGEAAAGPNGVTPSQQ